MGDSDEDYDRRGRRDKFRGERNDYDNRRPAPRGFDRGGRGGDRGWQDRKRDYNYGNRDNRDRRDNNFGARSPPAKRNKPDWLTLFFKIPRCRINQNKSNFTGVSYNHI